MTLEEAYALTSAAVAKAGSHGFHGDITIRLKAGQVTAVDVRQTHISTK